MKFSNHEINYQHHGGPNEGSPKTAHTSQDTQLNIIGGTRTGGTQLVPQRGVTFPVQDWVFREGGASRRKFSKHERSSRHHKVPIKPLHPCTRSPTKITRCTLLVTRYKLLSVTFLVGDSVFPEGVIFPVQDWVFPEGGPGRRFQWPQPHSGHPWNIEEVCATGNVGTGPLSFRTFFFIICTSKRDIFHL